MKVAAVTKIGKLNDNDPQKRGEVDLIDVAEAELGEEDVKIRVAYCAICGSDPHVAEGAFSFNVPQTLGHEISGIVEEIGSKVYKKGIKIGDRVAGNFLHFCGTCYYCQNNQQQFCMYAGERKAPGMGEYVIWHESQVYKLPDSISLRQGCMLEPLSIAVRAADNVNPKVGSRVAISGGGPIGQLILQILHMYGATSLTLIEPIENRRVLGLSFGAQYTIDPINQNVVEEALKITDGLGFDVVIDVSGVPSAAVILPAITAKGGTLLYGAMYPKEYEMPLNLFEYCYHNDLTIKGLFLSPYTFPRALALLEYINLEPFIEKSYPLEDVKEAFEMHMSGKYPKILIKCNNLD
ncbi:MAG: alcohol dehydrogenase catalytic domain-containing protein [Oscillospiraceae bacterium]|nr:alcohol dehydrogenase catalytic domain-containing protein [Oscillospiraceae bacterium]